MGVAVPIVGLALTAVGTVAQMSAQSQQAKAQKQAANYQAGMARNNQILSERAAADALARGKIVEQRQRNATKQLIGRQRAVLAANGVEVDTGSALDITSETAGIGELDALTIRSNAEREALGYRAQGMNFQGEAGLYAAQARGTSSGAFGTLLGGVGSVAEKWYSLSRQGAFGSPSSSFTPTYSATNFARGV